MLFASHTVQLSTDANARIIMTLWTRWSAAMNMPQGDRSRGKVASASTCGTVLASFAAGVVSLAAGVASLARAAGAVVVAGEGAAGGSDAAWAMRVRASCRGSATAGAATFAARRHDAIAMREKRPARRARRTDQR